MRSSDKTTAHSKAHCVQGHAGQRVVLGWPLFLLPFLLLLALEYMARVVTTIMAPGLERDFALGPGALGLIAGAYMVGFALLQLPVGILLDRFGPRPVLTVLLILAALGFALHAIAPSPEVLFIGRLLMGIGLAATLMGGIKSCSLWLPRDRLPEAMALMIAAVGIGGMLGTVPVAEILPVLGWRAVLAGLAIGCVGILVLMRIWLPPMTPGLRVPANPTAVRAGIVQVLGSLRFWSLVPLGMTGVGVVTTYQTLWVGPWLRDLTNLEAEGRAWVLCAMLGAMTVGSLLYGYLARRRTTAGQSPEGLVVTAFCLSLVVQALLASGLVQGLLPVVLLCWCLISLLYGGVVGTYALVAARFPVGLAGRVATSVNLSVFAMGFGMQWGVGLVIEAFDTAGPGQYPETAHRTALACLMAIQFGALAWYFWAKRHGPFD